MRRETPIWFLSTFFFVQIFYSECAQYECGAHGRFEYCIDDFSGCVVGCHCHPGYYFDTNTKVCEHNEKLMKDTSRRQYNPGPIDIETITLPNKNPSASTAANAVEEKIDEITKDADDLGDWLYNKFFKTIENQVINQTQNDKTIPTRRTGDVLLKKPSRRSRHKSSKTKRRSNKLKRKMLRITEDDSLFDSSDSDEISDETNSSSDSESDTSKRDDHNHKKLLIYNKKPQPPLPSFVFLPNMESSFYPPIGLPIPPMPMYPMIPVPPMMPGPPMGPLFPSPGVPMCDVKTTTTGPETSSSTSITENVPITDAPTEFVPTVPDPDVPISNETDQKLSQPLRSKLKMKNSAIEGIPHSAQRSRKNKLFKKLQEKLKRKNKLENYYVDEQNQGPDVSPDAPDTLSVHRPDLVGPYIHETAPEPPDVDFKYLAELIHKTDPSNTLKIPKQSQKNAVLNNMPLEPINSRRNYYQPEFVNHANVRRNNIGRQTSRAMEVNDSFYTNLGKQIASFITKLDKDGDREVNIEIEENKVPENNIPVFNENKYASRSLWERSVRSPLKYHASFRKEMENVKRSNEDLFSIENKVEVAASTDRVLSLYDLENIINTVQNTRMKPTRIHKMNEHSNASFKLNLLPYNDLTIIQHNIKPKQALAKTQPLERVGLNRGKEKILNYEGMIPKRRDITRKNVAISNVQPMLPNQYVHVLNTRNLNNSPQVTKNGKTLVLGPTRKTSKVAATPATYFAPYVMPPHVKAVELNHMSKDDYEFHKNPYLFEIPIENSESGQSTGLMQNANLEPSYFHHEFHHFDYFDK